MRVFLSRELEQALAYAATGEVAVHLHRYAGPGAPRCFLQALESGYPIAHVFGQDAETLLFLARRSGARKALVEREGTDRQHVDLCGQPLRRLLAEMGDNLEDYRETED